MCRAILVCCVCVGAYFDPTQIYYTTELILKNESKSNEIDLFANQNFLKNVTKFRDFHTCCVVCVCVN